MKSLLLPIVLILGLIVIFVIVDRNEFNRNDDVQTVQGTPHLTSEQKENRGLCATKPVQYSAAEAKTAEMKSVAKAKQGTETKPVKTQSTSSESTDRQNRLMRR